jgi:hypothetical protein
VILKTISDSYEALEHVKHLAVDIGSRAMGSPATRVAGDYNSEVFKKSGFSIERQEISCPEWLEEGTSFELNDESLEVSANTFSPPCDILKGMSWSRPEKSS